MDLTELRMQIDGIDDELVRLFQRRMDVAAEIAKVKLQKCLPVYDPLREQQKLCELSEKADDRCKEYITRLYSLIFELSRAEQERIIDAGARL